MIWLSAIGEICSTLMKKDGHICLTFVRTDLRSEINTDLGKIGRHPWRSGRQRTRRERHRHARGRRLESSLAGAADGDRESESRSAGGRGDREKNGRRMRAREENSQGWRRKTGDSRPRRKEEREVAEEREI
ncbi:hypothetical protein TIFTF001_032090 [Ficus carica]|uniref:Uncharacterized protein n=1 Tax=Ficus carica TaxID=3494 RepID=A0AA88J1Y7_FICCA|nr:hypothetical protein TIFTF001_032090 [Ficus carica]